MKVLRMNPSSVTAIALAAVFGAACSSSDDPSTPQSGDEPNETDNPPVDSDPPESDPPPVVETPDDSTNPPAEPTESAALRVIHAAPGAPRVDVYAKGSDTPAVTDLGYGMATAYLSLPAGSYEFELRAAGADAASPPIYVSPVVELMGEERYSAIAAGSVAEEAAADASFRVVPLVESYAPAANGTYRARILHASEDAPTVGIDVGADDSANPEVAAIERFADTGAEGVELPAQSALQVGIVAGGSTVTGFTVPASIEPGSEVLVIATGQVTKTPGDESGFSLLAVFGDGTSAWIRQNPIVYALHASTEAPSVDVYAGDAELIDELEYGELSTGLQLPPGAYDLDFFVAEPGPTARPGTAPAVVGSTGELEAGRRYLAVATGSLTDFRVLGFADDFATSDDSATLRVIHAAPGAPSVDVGTFSDGTMDGTLIAGLEFPNASDQDLVLGPASYDIGIAAAGIADTVAEFPAVAVDAGLRAFVVAAGDLGAEERPFGLFVIATSPSTLDREWTIAAIANQK